MIEIKEEDNKFTPEEKILLKFNKVKQTLEEALEISKSIDWLRDNLKEVSVVQYDTMWAEAFDLIYHLESIKIEELTEKIIEQEARRF